MKKILLFISFLSPYLVSAQSELSSSNSGKTRSLAECIQEAYANNPSIKQSQLALEAENVRLSQAKTLKLPIVNGFTNLNGNAGRNIDPFTNSVVTQTIGTNSLGVQANMDVFDGSNNKNTVLRSQLNVQSALLDLSVQKNTIALQVAVSYLNVLSAEDQIEIARKQIEATQIQVDRTTRMVKSGAMPETNLYDLEAQMANDDLNLVNAQNAFEAAKLTLKQAINSAENYDIKTTRVGIPNLNIERYPQTASEIYTAAVSFLPEVKAGEIRIKAADKSIDIAKSLGLPSVSLNSSWGTAYSSVAKNLNPGPTKSQAIPVSAEFQGQTVPFVINFPQQSFTSENIPYFNQIGNNQTLNLGLSVRVPIFNGYNAKYQVQTAKIQKLQTEVQNESTLLQIRQNIDQAYSNMLNAQKRFTATQAQVNALEKAYKASELRYGAGSGTFIDYNLAKTNLDRAQSSLVIAKYDFIFRTKILDFYQNKPLSF